MTIACIEYDSRGHVCRILRVKDPAKPVLEVLATGHSISQEDVDWCKRDECHYRHGSGFWTGRVYLHKLVGGGAAHRLWAAPWITFSKDSGGSEMLSASEIAALGYELDQESERPELPYLADGSTYYCERCDDYLPETDHCECVFWCNECGMFLDKQSEACEHYCPECEGEAGYSYCDSCDERVLAAEAALQAARKSIADRVTELAEATDGDR